MISYTSRLLTIIPFSSSFFLNFPAEILHLSKLSNKKFADTYIAELFLALSQDAFNKSSQGYKKLVADSQTPKGLNMQVLNELKKGKFFTKFTNALENVNKRVSK